MFRLTDLTPRALAAATLLGALVLASPAGAAPELLAQAQTPPVATPTPQYSAQTPATTSQKSSSSAKATHARYSPTERVEQRIKDLHTRLGITPDQETQWNTVAQVMRDNAQAIEKISTQRTQNIKSMTAIDDLRSYESLSETHTDGLKKLVTVFEPLYNSMSDAQKKNADAVFSNVRHHGRPASSSSKSK